MGAHPNGVQWIHLYIARSVYTLNVIDIQFDVVLVLYLSGSSTEEGQR